MAKRRKKISVNAFERCVANVSGDPVIIKEWNGVDIIINKRLTLPEMMSFVDGVVKSCFTDDDSVYMPEVRDFALRCSVLEMYGNFSLPANIEKKYELVYGCDACEVILSEIDRSQFDAMLQAIDEKIDHIAEANIEAIHRQINDLYASFSGLDERLSSVFSGIDKDMMTGLVSAMSGSKIDEETLIKTYLKTKEELDHPISIVPEKDGE